MNEMKDSKTLTSNNDERVDWIRLVKGEVDEEEIERR